MRPIRCSLAFVTIMTIFVGGCGGGGGNATLKNDPKVSAKNEEEYKKKMEEAMKNKAAPTKPKYGGPQ